MLKLQRDRGKKLTGGLLHVNDVCVLCVSVFPLSLFISSWILSFNFYCGVYPQYTSLSFLWLPIQVRSDFKVLLMTQGISLCNIIKNAHSGSTQSEVRCCQINNENWILNAWIPVNL